MIICLVVQNIPAIVMSMRTIISKTLHGIRGSLSAPLQDESNAVFPPGFHVQGIGFPCLLKVRLTIITCVAKVMSALGGSISEFILIVQVPSLRCDD